MKNHNENLNKKMKKALDGATYNLIKKAGRLADKLGIKAYVVGGMVRDVLINRKTVDIDIMTIGDGTFFAKILADDLKGAYKKFDKFKTAKIFLKNGRIDVSSARSETYEKPAAQPKVRLSSLKDDLYRRDFSINAMAVSINKNDFGMLFDMFGSILDLKNKILRTMHDKSFIDDPTRILRAIRFESRLGFTLDLKSEKLFKQAVKNNCLNLAAGERLLDEIMILMGEIEPYKAALKLEQTDVLSSLFPGVSLNKESHRLFEKIKKVRNINVDKELLNFMCLLSGANAEQIQAACKKLKISNKKAELVTKALKNRELMSHINNKNVAKSHIYTRLKGIEAESLIFLKAFSANTPAEKNIDYYMKKIVNIKLEINGNDLKTIGVKEGPKYLHIFEKVICAKVDGVVNSRNEELALAQEIVDKEGIK